MLLFLLGLNLKWSPVSSYVPVEHILVDNAELLGSCLVTKAAKKERLSWSPK